MEEVWPVRMSWRSYRPGRGRSHSTNLDSAGLCVCVCVCVCVYCGLFTWQCWPVCVCCRLLTCAVCFRDRSLWSWMRAFWCWAATFSRAHSGQSASPKTSCRKSSDMCQYPCYMSCPICNCVCVCVCVLRHARVVVFSPQDTIIVYVRYCFHELMSQEIKDVLFWVWFCISWHQVQFKMVPVRFKKTICTLPISLALI